MTAAKRLPYPGLRAFTRDESDLFFGRDGCINAMVDRFAATRFLSVLGPSGGGKSSLVRTGFEDALNLGLHPWAGVQWKVADMHPGGQPMHNLAEALLSIGPLPAVDETDIQFLSDFLRRGPRAVVEWAEGGNLESGWNLLILVDQFEELFRYGDYAQREEAEAFVALLIESASARSVPIHIVLTMRSEYLGACALITGLADCINAGLYLTPRMSREECREAVEGPANVLGFKVEPALVNHLLNDLGSFAPWETGPRVDQAERLSRQADQLPVMQHVLNRLWVRADSEANGAAIVLRLADYDRIGGLSGALDAHGDEVMAALGADRATAIETIFRALVAGQAVSSAVRRPTTLGELVELTGNRQDVIAILDAFRAPGCNFLRTSEKSLADDRVIVDISHESLIRQWTPLREWLQKEARSAAAWQRLLAAELHFREHEGGLLSGTDLASLEAFWESAKPTPVWAARHGGRFEEASAFLAASRDAEAQKIQAERQKLSRERNRLRTYVAGLAVALVIIIVFALRMHRDNQIAAQATQAKLQETKATLAAEEGAVIAEEEVVKQQAKTEAEAKNTAKVLNEVSDTLYSDRFKDQVGFGELRSDLMKKILPYQQELLQQHKEALSPSVEVRDQYRLGATQESVGDAKSAMDAYASAYEKGKSLIEALGGKSPDQELEASFLEDGVIYAWDLLDIGETEKGNRVIETLIQLAPRFQGVETSARLLVDRGKVEGLESRYYSDLKQPGKSRTHARMDMALSDQALALPNAELRTISHVFWARHNYSLALSGAQQEGMEQKACQISERLMSQAPFNNNSILAQIRCLSDVSGHASDKSDFKTAEARLAEAHQILDHALMFSPKEQTLLLALADVENSLGDVEYNELKQASKASADTGTKEGAGATLRDASGDMEMKAADERRKHKAAALDFLVKAIQGRTVMQSSTTQLKNLYLNARYTTFTPGKYFTPGTESQFYKDIYDAMGSTLAAFPNAPSYQYIAADASANLSRILSDDPTQAKIAQEYATKAIAWFEKRRVTADTKSYTEEFDRYCEAYADRAEAEVALGDLNSVLAELNRVHSVCSPILKRYPWDVYLRMHGLRIEQYAGKMLFNLHRFKEASQHLEIASHWGVSDSTTALAQMYDQGLGRKKDAAMAQELEKLAKRQSMWSFTVRCDFGGTEAPFKIFVREWPADYTRLFAGVDDQAKWLKEARGGTMPDDVVATLRKLQKVATENDVGFPNLVAYWVNPDSYTSNAMEEARKAFEASRNATTLENWRAAGKERYDYLVGQNKQSDADLIDSQLSKAAEALVEKTKTADAYRAAWSVFFDVGSHRNASNTKDAREALARSAQIAELLPRDNPDDLLRRTNSYANLVLFDRKLANSAAVQSDLSEERKLPPMIAGGTPDGEFARYMAFNALGDSLRGTSGDIQEARASYAQSASALARYISTFRKASPPSQAAADENALYACYGNLSWILDKAGDFSKAIEAAQAGLGLNPEAAYIEANLAHALLLSGHQQEAKEHYRKVRKATVDSRSMLKATTEDFETLKQLGFVDPAMDDILKQMKD